jgi:hypothetical protein
MGNKNTYFIPQDHKEDVVDFLQRCKNICVRNQMYEWSALIRQNERDLSEGKISIRESLKDIGDLLDNTQDEDLLNLFREMKQEHRHKVINSLLK